MRKLVLLFCFLQIAFGSLWAVKAKEPEERPDAYAYGADEKEGAWWLRAEDLPDVGEEWYLDPEIPRIMFPFLEKKNCIWLSEKMAGLRDTDRE